MCSSHCGIFLLLFVLREAVSENQHDLCKLSFPEDMAGEPSVKVTEADVQQCDGYGAITEIMVNLNILPHRKFSCYTMKKVSRLVSKAKAGDTARGITITIHFEENFDNSFSGNGNSDVSMSSRTGSDVTKSCWSSGGTYKRGFLGQQSMSMVQGNGQGDNNTKNNTTGVYAATSKNKSNTDDDGGGLSHTQVVVIATCSSVIGTFFIVAAVLRIRNYLKRWREEQARRNNYRGCGMAPPRPCNTSRECVQRDSTSSKGSRQSGTTTKGGNRYFPVNSHGVPNSPTASPNHCLANDDTNPLLVVTAPSTVPNSPTDSHASIQFIDEETEKNKTSVIKEAEDEHQEQEQEPLLAAAELPVEAPATMTTSVDSISSEDEVCNDDSPACCLSSRTEKPVLIREPTIEEETLLGNNTSTNNKCEVENIPNNENLLSDDSSISNDMSSPSSNDVNMLPDMLSVTVGLTQSDESLTCSHNASYSYGNQTEYSSHIYDMEIDFGSCGNCDADMSISPEYDSKDNISDSEDTSKLLDSTQPIGSSSLSSSPDQCDDNADVNNKDICGNIIHSPREKLTSQDSTVSWNDNEIIGQTADSNSLDQNTDNNVKQLNMATECDKVQSQV